MKIKDIIRRSWLWSPYERYGLFDLLINTAKVTNMSLIKFVNSDINTHRSYMDFLIDDDMTRFQTIQTPVIQNDYMICKYQRYSGKQTNKIKLSGHIITDFKIAMDTFNYVTNMDNVATNNAIQKSINPMVTKDCNPYTKEYNRQDWIIVYSNIKSCITRNKFYSYFSGIYPDLKSIRDYYNFIEKIVGVQPTPKRRIKSNTEYPDIFYGNYDRFSKYYFSDKYKLLNITIHITKIIKNMLLRNKNGLSTILNTEWYLFSNKDKNLNIKFDRNILMLINKYYSSFTTFMDDFVRNETDKLRDSSTNDIFKLLVDFNDKNLDKCLSYNTYLTADNKLIKLYMKKNNTELINDATTLSNSIKSLLYKISLYKWENKINPDQNDKQQFINKTTLSLKIDIKRISNRSNSVIDILEYVTKLISKYKIPYFQTINWEYITNLSDDEMEQYKRILAIELMTIPSNNTDNNTAIIEENLNTEDI